jgi:transcriptional regulator with XRE-family HTH domain
MLKEFAERLRSAREGRGMSQSELAQKSGLQPSAVSHFETGRRSPSFDNLRKLADALSVSTDFLLGRADTPGFSGPATTNLFRHAERLSNDDLEKISEFAKLLADRRKPEASE